MKILLIEDHDDYIENIKSQILSVRGDIDFNFAKSRNSAEKLIKDNFFDLIVLDLKIPAVDGTRDAEPEHGHATFEYARTHASGTPLFVLTGSAAEPFIDKLQENINQIDIWGMGRIQTVTFLQKHKFGSSFPALISPYLNGCSSMLDVELSGNLTSLSIKDSRVIRIFANSKGAVKCYISLLTGGLSGVKVIRLRLTNAAGAPVLEAVAKLGSKDDVFDENARFESHVIRLEGKATPRKLGIVEYGAGNVFGVFYSLAAGYDTDAFNLAAGNDDVSESIVLRIAELTKPWSAGVPETRQLIQTLRQRAINDAAFARVRGEIPFQWIEEFERRNIQIKLTCCHGDLHGKNVLAALDGSPVLIDYGDVGDASASWDPITLELSLLFHTDGPLRNSEWPTEEDALNWGDIDLYVKNCPMPRFVRACRAWANITAAGNREVAACAYSYLVRQLKYENDRKKIFPLIAGAKKLFDNA